MAQNTTYHHQMFELSLRNQNTLPMSINCAMLEQMIAMVEAIGDEPDYSTFENKTGLAEDRGENENPEVGS